MFDFEPGDVLAAAKLSESFTAAARFWTGRLIFRIGDIEAYVLEGVDGRPVDFTRNDGLLADKLPLSSSDIAISGPAESWRKLLSEVPPPGFHDPLFFNAEAGFRIEGERVTAMAPFFRVAQEFIDLLRLLHNDLAPPSLTPEVTKDFDDAVGRYMYLHVQGVQYRIYYEEAGHGTIPLLLQHTAGSDGRQYRHILEDPDYQKLYRIITYDLPFHGRSLPPSSQPWWEKRYKLTRTFLMDTVVAISKKLGLDRPVYMGCSVGGMLAPDLAYYHPDEFRAVIGLNASLGFDEQQRAHVEGVLDLWSDPRIGPQWRMARMRANTAPTSPEAFRRETMWLYSQGGPDVIEGDVHYYAFDHDLTAEQAAQIDTSKIDVYLLTGAYDGLAINGASMRLAKAIPGCHYELIPELGHFGPAENPETTKPALLRVLTEIAIKSR